MEKQQLISVKSFSADELRKWQLKLLDILVYFRDFCESHNLRFYLAAGTCIGAVRHHGFIPWDDDLDVQMPRKDFEKLFELWERDADKSRFRCERTDESKCVKFQMGLARSMDTTCIFDHSVDMDICQGLKIDIEFLDGVPNEKWKRKINEIVSKLFALLRAERVPNRKSKAVEIMSKVLLTLFPTHRIRYKVSRMLEKYLMRYDFDGDYEYVRYLSTDLRRSERILRPTRPTNQGINPALKTFLLNSDLIKQPRLEHSAAVNVAVRPSSWHSSEIRQSFFLMNQPPGWTGRPKLHS